MQSLGNLSQYFRNKYFRTDQIEDATELDDPTSDQSTANSGSSSDSSASAPTGQPVVLNNAGESQGLTPSPSMQDYLDAAADVYLQDILSAPNGLTLVEPANLISSENLSDGFYAQAFQDAYGNIIIAYEGSLDPLSSAILTTYGQESDLDDVSILNGQIPKSLFNDAYNFAKQVKLDFGSQPIYVTGHSLGGVEAQYVASQLSFVQGGATFGAPGLPDYYGNPLGTGSGTFINYVDYGDPVGNYASDALSAVPYVIPGTGDHFGKVEDKGSQADALPDFLGILGLLYDLATYHPIQEYASDLSKTLAVDISTTTTVDINLAYEFDGLDSSIPPPNSSNPHPVITNQPIVPASTNAYLQLAALFPAGESPAGSGHSIVSYTVTYIVGPGQIVLGDQTYSAGATIRNVSPAQFVTAYFSAGATPGVNEIEVTAYDDAGTASAPADTAIEVAAADNPQPVNSNNTTPPTIVAPTQPLVVGVGDSETISSNFLQVTDSAGYSPGQLKYIITSAPTNGWLVKSGSIVSSFTQADIDNGLVRYQENGTVAPSDSFSYYVSDPNGNETPVATRNIQIPAPPVATSASLTTNSALSVGQGLSAVIADSNLDVTDSGVNRWQIVYTIKSGPNNGQIVNGGVGGSNPITFFTQQELDLDLIAYRNTGNVSGIDDFTFTVSDGSGGTIGQTTFDINVIPKNNLSVTVERPLSSYDASTSEKAPGTNIPLGFTLVSSDVLSAVDQGVPPEDITYTVNSVPANAAGFQVENSDGLFFGVTTFTQAQVNAEQVFYAQMDNQGNLSGEQVSATLSAQDNFGNSVSDITLPIFLYPLGMLSNGQFTLNTSVPYVPLNLTASVGQPTVVGQGVIDFLMPWYSSPQIQYELDFAPTAGTLFLNGTPLTAYGQGFDPNATQIITQSDIDDGHLTYIDNNPSAGSDSFWLWISDPFDGGLRCQIAITLTGSNGGQVLIGSSNGEILDAGTGNNYFIGDGNTTVSYANSPNGVTVDLIHGTASNGYGGTDTLTNIHSVIGSSYGDTLIAGVGASGNDTLTGGSGANTFVYATGGGADTITDFSDAQGDKIDLTGVAGIYTLADVQSHATQSGANTILNLGNGNMLTLDSVAAGNLNAADFVFSSAPPEPVLSGGGNSVNYVPQGAAVAVDAGLAASDAGSATLAGATVAISAGLLAGDTLNFTNQNGISGSYNATTGVLTLTGSASLANYQAALKSITFSSTSGNPSNSGTDTTRTVSWTVTDGTLSSNTVASTIAITSVSPVLSGGGNSVYYTPQGAAVAIDAGLGVGDVSSATLVGASVAISTGFLAGDTLNFANQNGISGSYDASTGVMTLTGSASLANYQAALESITFSSTSSNPSNSGADPSRTVSWTVTDGTLPSNTIASTIAITHVPPTVSAQSFSVSANQSVPISSYFSVSNPSGDSITQYGFYDAGSGNGHFTLSGTVEPDGQWIDVSVANLSSVQYAGGTSAGSETLYVDVYDATTATWSASSSLTATTTHLAPTVNVQNVSVNANASIAASSLITSISNLSGDSITQYGFYDAGSGNGHFTLSGAAEPNGQWIDVSVANLSSIRYLGGSAAGSETLYVDVYDATTATLSASSSLTATTTPPIGPNPPPPAGTTVDMIMRDGNNGAFEIYDIGSNAILAGYPLGQVGSEWQVAGLGGFYGTDTSDMILRDSNNAAFEVYDISNNSLTGAASLGQVGLEWQVAGFGDLSSRAGETDMLLRNGTTGAFEVYDISNNALTSAAAIGAVGSEWTVAGFGDFSGNANETDMLMRNNNTGALEVYDISHNALTSAAAIGAVGLEWTVAGFGDFSGNANETDMLMRNSTNGAFEVYDISHNALTSAAAMGAVGLEWTVVGFGDFSGNTNETDMLMRDSNTGAFEVYDISHNALTSAASMGQVGLEWTVAGIAADPPGAASPAGSIPLLVQAMASLGASAAVASAPGTILAGPDTQQQPHLTLPH